MAKIIAIANQKGGVGKTTTAFNLGAALVQEHEKRVLLVDIDPQANLSEYLGYDDEQHNVTMTQLIGSVARQSSIEAKTVKSAIRRNDSNTLDYLPADINLANAETIMATALARETIVKRILSENVTAEYDYVIIDCLPSLGILLINALTAADHMIIPVQTQKFSMDGLAALIELHKQIRATINPRLDILGILPTMTDNTNVSRNALDRLSDMYGDMMLDICIHKSVSAAMSSETGKALCKTKNKLGEEYKALAQITNKKLMG